MKLRLVLILIAVMTLVGIAGAYPNNSTCAGADITVPGGSISIHGTTTVNLSCLYTAINNVTIMRYDAPTKTYYINASITSWTPAHLNIDDEQGNVIEIRIDNPFTKSDNFALQSYINITNVTVASWNTTTAQYRNMSNPLLYVKISGYMRNATSRGFIYTYTMNSNLWSGNVYDVILTEGYYGFGMTEAAQTNRKMYNLTVLNTTAFGMSMSSCDNIEIYNFTSLHTGNHSAYGTGRAGISIGSGCENVSVRDFSINDTGWEGFGTSNSPVNVTFRNGTVKDAGHNAMDLHGCVYCLIDNISIADGVSNNYYITSGNNITVKNIRSTHSIGYALDIDGAPLDGVLVENFTIDSEGAFVLHRTGAYLRNITVRNVTWTNDSSAKSARMWGNCENCTFQDFPRANISMEAVSNSRLINVNYDAISYNGPTNIDLTDMYYAHIHVQDISGNPIQNAVITLTTNNSNSSVLDARSQYQSNFYTDVNGNTSLPGANRSNSPVIPYWHRNTSTGSLEYIKTNVSVSASGYVTNSSINITPNLNWYRNNSDTIQNETIIILATTDVLPTTPGIPMNIASTSGKNYINATWEASAGVITDSFNVSVNTTWYNGTLDLFFNNTGLPNHNWSNVTVYAWNNSGNGNISNGSISLNAQLNLYSISGYVTDNYGYVVSGASVTSSDGSNTTNATGYYIISDLLNGTYNLSFSKTGYATGTLSVAISGANATNQDIVLTVTNAQSAYKTSTCRSTLGWGEVGSALLVVLIIVMAGGMAWGFMSGSLKMETFPIQEFVFTLVLVVVIGGIGVAIINPIIIAVGCP